MAKHSTRKKATGASESSAPLPATVSIAAQLAKPTQAQFDAAREKFEQGIVSRGEAVPANASLKPGATHKIVGHRADGTPILARQRFSIR